MNAMHVTGAKRGKTRATQVMIGFGLVSHWLKKWREFCYPNTKRSKAKPKQLPNYFRHSIENRSNCSVVALFLL